MTLVPSLYPGQNPVFVMVEKQPQIDSMRMNIEKDLAKQRPASVSG